MAMRKAIPKLVERLVYQEAENRCVHCGKDDLKKLRVHHIVPYAENPTHDLAHLILLCLDCHDDADRGLITREDLYAMKKKPKAKVIPSDDVRKISVTGDNNLVAGGNMHVEGDIHVKYTQARGKRSAPIIIPGTVATDVNRYNYLEYLVRRYNEFKKSECDQKGELMKYALIRNAYMREFSCKVKDTPLDRFDDAVAYLQYRITNTILGRNYRKQGRRMFSTFEEFCQR